MATGQELDQQIPLQYAIETRDGTLNADSKMVNCFAEKEGDGAAVVKRSGTVPVVQFPPGVSQGMCTASLEPYAIIGDVLYKVSDGTQYPIPSVTTPGQVYSVLSDAPVGTTLLKSADGLWVFSGVAAVKVTDINYPTLTLYGIVELDGTYYIMDNGGTIHGSALQDPFTWPALNTIAPDGTFQGGTGIFRHLNYIAAHFQKGIQFYYDAGNSPGIPISPVQNASWTMGSVNPLTVVETFDQQIFMSRSNEAARAIHMITGLQMGQISNPYIDRIIRRADLSNSRSYATKINGHNFYVLTMRDLNITLVYDTDVKEWYQFSSMVNGVEQYLLALYAVSSSQKDYLLEDGTGTVVSWSDTAYGDSNGLIQVLIRTNPRTWGTLKWKRFAAMFLHGDTVNGSVLVRYSDDDYQTWSPYRPINLSSVRKMLQRCGRSRKRSWDFLFSDLQPLRLESCEFDMSVGPS